MSAALPASMFAHYPHPVALIGADYTIRDTNFGMERLLGLEHGRAVGMRLLDLVAPQDSERLRCALDRAARLEPVRDFALRLALPGKREASATATLAPAEPPGAGIFLALRNGDGRETHPGSWGLALAQRGLQLQAAALDALPAHVALLDAAGRILAVNEAWRCFGRDHGLEDPACCVGEDYVAVCRAAAPGSPEAAAALAGLQEVLSGVRAAFELEYPCHGPARRWFRLHVNALRSPLAPGAVVMHVEVTERHFADERARLAARALRRVSKAAESAESEYRHRLDHAAHHDRLTGLANRSALESFARQALVSGASQPGICALMLINIDGFRTLNESLGHAPADAFLQEAASRIRAAAPPGDLVARLGADEFALMLVGLPDAAAAHAHAVRVADHMRSPVTSANGTPSLTVSIGFSCYPGDGESFETLLRAATISLGEAKKAGANSIRAYGSHMRAAAGAKLNPLWNDFAAALRTGQFELFYQPIVDLGTGKARSMEALLRWRHPELGLLAPNQFIALAEERGAIVEIGDWVLHRACGDAMRLRASMGCPIRVAVNLSARQFERADLATKVAAALRTSGLDAADLRLEITETTAMADPAASCSILGELAAMGIGLALDDFGTGYSSLGYLQRFPLTSLKIDRSFVAGLPACERAASIARIVVLLGKALHMRIVAEGVENETQLEFLRANGCDEVQGYFFATPLPYEEAAKWIAARDSSSDAPEGGAPSI